LVQVGGGEPRPAPRPPQVELVRLAHVQPVDDVAPVDEAWAGDDEIGAAVRGQVAKRAGHRRRHVGSQEPGAVEVAGVAGLTGRSLALRRRWPAADDVLMIVIGPRIGLVCALGIAGLVAGRPLGSAILHRPARPARPPGSPPGAGRASSPSPGSDSPLPWAPA